MLCICRFFRWRIRFSKAVQVSRATIARQALILQNCQIVFEIFCGVSLYLSLLEEVPELESRWYSENGAQFELRELVLAEGLKRHCIQRSIGGTAISKVESRCQNFWNFQRNLHNLSLSQAGRICRLVPRINDAYAAPGKVSDIPCHELQVVNTCSCQNQTIRGGESNSALLCLDGDAAPRVGNGESHRQDVVAEPHGDSRVAV